MADFAPYQDTSPEAIRALSPPPQRPSLHSPRASIDNTRRSNSISPNPRPSLSNNRPYTDDPSTTPGSFLGSDVQHAAAHTGNRGDELNMFETSLGLRLDWEACLAYLLLPPAGGVFLLVMEQRSDYVRFHAWQSSLLFTFLFVIHVIFSWSSFFSYLILVVDLGLIGYLTFHAYRDAELLDRCEIPFFGPLASSILDDE